MKKVAVVLSTFPQEGGQFQYEALLAELLHKNSDGRYQLVAFCRNSYWVNWCRRKKLNYRCMERSTPVKNEILFQSRHPFLSGVYHRFFTPAGKALREERVDLIVTGQQGLFLPNYLIPEIRPVHDLMHRYERNFPEIAETYQERELLFRSVAGNAAVILTDSVLGKKQFTESYLSGRKKRPKIKVLPFIAPRHEEEESIGIPEKYIFYPAQFWEHKNHLNLLKAVSILKEKIPDICLVLTGSEKNALKDIRRYISEQRLEQNVIIKGFVSDGAVSYLYRRAVGLVMPTKFGPTNIPPLEAMSLGCPVAVSNKYAMPEQVGGAGLLFDPDSPREIADCILKMWTDEKLRETMIQKGYLQIQKWTEADFERTFLEIVMEELFRNTGRKK